MNSEFCTLEDLEGNCDENEVDGHAYTNPYYKDVLELLHKKGGIVLGTYASGKYHSLYSTQS